MRTSRRPAFAAEVGRRLRAIRTQQALSLQDVEARSGGRWKTAAIGSYERADRMISVSQLADLAGFYGVPTGALLDHGPSIPSTREARIVLNLPALAQAPQPASTPLRRWVEHIRQQRDDYAGRVLSIRHGDLRSLATIYDRDPDEILEMLRAWRVLDPISDVAGETPAGS
jgi:transcriptional regulator with XRE-family HTH domain